MIVSRCAICGGKVEERKISEEVKVRNDFVVIENVRAGVCVECGERYYPPGVVDRLRNIEKSIMDRKRLKKLNVIGSTYRLGYDAATFWDSVAEELARKGMDLPSSSGLKEGEIKYICDAIKDIDKRR